MHFDGPTAGPLGGALDLVVTARDGSFPTNPGTCEPVDVTYAGTGHKKAMVVGDGLMAAASSWLGGQASVSAAVRW